MSSEVELDPLTNSALKAIREGKVVTQDRPQQRRGEKVCGGGGVEVNEGIPPGMMCGYYSAEFG